MMQMFRRTPVPQRYEPKIRQRFLPPPVGGWVTNASLAAQSPRSARVMDNCFPEQDGVRLRGGYTKAATIGNDRVEALFRFIQGGSEKLFACSDSDIYDISALNDTTPPAADVSSQTSGYYSTAQIATSGGEYLYACNEADNPQLYDGSTWTTVTNVSTPAITGTTSSDTSLLRACWVYRNRLFFVERDSLNAWALPTESIGGAAIQINLAGVFNDGGNLLFGATWSLDAGDGVDDKCVFVSDLGEIAVYEGGSPDDPTDWNLVGVYRTSTPLGKNAWEQIGGDLLIGTVDGIMPLTQILRRDPAEMLLAAITRAIEPDWKVESRSRVSTYPWEILKFDERGMLLISLPHSINQQTQKLFVANTETGAWCRWTGLDVQCMAVYGATAYFGASDGEVYSIETGGKDDTDNYVCRLAYAWDHLSKPGYQKNAVLMRGQFLAANAFNVNLECHTDYVNDWGSAPNAAADGSGDAVWDTAVWDTDTWDDGTADSPTPILRTSRWQSVVGPGTVHAAAFQITVGNTQKPDAALQTIELLYEEGGLVV